VRVSNRICYTRIDGGNGMEALMVLVVESVEESLRTYNVRLAGWWW